MARGGKFSKPTRGGGKKFSRDVRPAEDAPGMWDDGPREKEEEEDDSEEESSEEEEESDEDESGAGSSAKPTAPVITADMSRDERRAAQKALKEAKRAQQAKGIASLSISDDEDEEEEAASSSKEKQPKAAVPGFQIGNPNAGNIDPTMSRREREAAEAAAAKERYRKLHEAGKTEEAKSDLARLAIIRKEREEKAKQRQAELDEKKRQADIKAQQSKKKLK
ncbi:hypothetical protein TWF696_007822 [Orbilia brochopaga]|uniref:Casein kinase substrate phosphoprotein PP28 domain-containing protein n=1 Tax=Orbilia brochopaga TaxID=3140254 RepID=A0AAV9UM67_9PEZI